MERNEALQYLFSKSVKHVLQQGRPSGHIHSPDNVAAGIGPYFRCDYRSPDGCMCAAGPFITNYNPSMENKSWNDVSRMWPDDVEPVALEYASFVCELQDAHDGSAAAPLTDFVAAFKREATATARRYGIQLSAELEAELA